ncbi:3'-5' exoribonuclease HELZ2-like [Antedon mediterranea]|uniref:3'-5' exoribonuclease HELZ2-like n=1 Tax=Antedon mediterranea TaxID=105859 RepID=UPI003AF622CE
MDFMDFKCSFSAFYENPRYKWLRFLLFEFLTIDDLTSTESGNQLLNDLEDIGVIADKDVHVLLQIANLSCLVKAQSLVIEYMKKNGQNTSDTNISGYRKRLFKALRDAGKKDYTRIIAYYKLMSNDFPTTWDLVFHLETEKILEDDPEKIKRFAGRLNQTAKNRLLDISEQIPISLSRKRKYDDSEDQQSSKRHGIENEIVFSITCDKQEKINIYFRSSGSGAVEITKGSIVFHVSFVDPNALTNIWKLHQSGQLLKDIAGILFTDEHRQEFEETWETQLDRQIYIAALDKLNEKSVKLSNTMSPVELPTYWQQPQQLVGLSFGSFSDVHSAEQDQTQKAQNIERVHISTPATEVSGTLQTNQQVSSQSIPVHHHCSYCEIDFDLLLPHISTLEHKKWVDSDTDRNWKYRNPPLKIVNGQFVICDRNKQNHCPHSNADPASNQCMQAHSPEELEEWKERHEYRMMKRDKKKSKLFIFMDQLLEEYNSAFIKADVMTEKDLPNIWISCDSKLDCFIDANKSDDTFKGCWHFQVKCTEKEMLKRIGLLHDEHRSQFFLSHPEKEVRPQVCPGNMIMDEYGAYNIDVHFTTHKLGSFHQWVVFDFGKKPIMFRELKVLVGAEGECESNSKSQSTIIWDTSNTEIIRSTEPSSSDEDLLRKYKPPSANLNIDYLNESELTRENYKHRMHNMVNLEERDRMKMINRLNTMAQMDILSSITIESYAESELLTARKGELYGKINLTDTLNFDFESNQLIMESVQTVLCKFDSESNEAYELKIVSNESISGDYIYVNLNAKFVEKLQLEAGPKSIEFQFQLDRLLFCQMHLAIDSLTNLDSVLPTRGDRLHIPDDFPIENDNKGQEQVIQCLAGTPAISGPPLVIYGPFGTGKTRTMAESVKKILLKDDTTVLICTMSNSSADLYITDYLDKYLNKSYSKRKCPKLLRVYASRRRINTIPSEVKKYCLIDKTTNTINLPTKRDVIRSRVVICTLNMTLTLVRLNVKGYFTHILIDEAGQALETQAIMPLAMAERTTCIAIAGDHMQMSPKVYSEEARIAGFDQSILKRLHDHYENTGDKNTIFLYNNYRTCQEILSFVSEAFYGIKLISMKEHPPHPTLYPLSFYAVSGQDHPIGTSYWNNDEVEELGIRVEVLYHNWPQEWGKKIDIGVVTPYGFQACKLDLFFDVTLLLVKVREIRRELRSRNLPDVTVESVRNIQGKEFRALFINVVRTKATIPQTYDFGKYHSPDASYGFLSDKKLLNTAFTRAKSLLVVVGDPTTMYSIRGNCSNVWKKFLQTCDQQIRKGIGPAATFKPSVTEKDEDVSKKKSKAKISEDFPPLTTKDIDKNFFDEGQGNYESKGDKIDVKAKDDSILKVLRGLVKKTASRPPSDVKETKELEDLTKLVKQLFVPEKDYSKLQGSDFFEEYDPEIDTIIRSEELDQDKKYEPLLESEPEKYKRCIFHLDVRGKTHATTLDEHINTRISIINKHDRGQALNMDEVIVDIQKTEEDTSEKHGKVVHILKRASDPYLRKIVCMLDKYSNNHMVPINKAFPKLYILSKDKNKPPSEDFLVEIYTLSKQVDSDKPFFDTQQKVLVTNKDRSHKLFVVRYWKWHSKMLYPIGFVTEELPPATNKAEGIRILKLIHGVEDIWKKKVCEKLDEKFSENWKIPEDEIKMRTDFRNVETFTIDPKCCQDIDDALSIRKVADDLYEVGVHIADVSYFVGNKTLLDEEAQKRATTYYPTLSAPINMLPSRLSNDLCSLIPGKDRLTMSVFMDISTDGLHSGTKIVKSVIQSRQKFTYTEAEDIIHNGNNDLKPSIVTAINKLNELAQKTRTARLKEGRFSYNEDENEEEASCPLAHSLIEEFMVLANKAVADYLMERFPQCVPLRRQLSPDPEKLQEFQAKHLPDIRNSKEMLGKFKDYVDSSQCNCDNVCKCGKKSNTITMLTWEWNQLVEVVNNIKNGADASLADMMKIIKIVCTDNKHPKLSVMMAHYNRIQEKSDYKCSGQSISDGQDLAHHFLEIDFYTHFTSPIRRYIDIVVHRLVDAAINQQDIPYTEEEISSICYHASNKSSNATAFEKSTKLLTNALKLKESSMSCLLVVEQVSDKCITFDFPSVIPINNIDVGLNMLKPFKKPDVKEDTICLIWKQEIYDAKAEPKKALQKMDSIAGELDANRFVVTFNSTYWQEILSGIEDDDIHQIRAAMHFAAQEIETTEKEKNQRTMGKSTNGKLLKKEVTSEVLDRHGNRHHFVEFNREYSPGHVVEVKLMAGLERGILEPKIQLFNLTPELDICLEHRSDPVTCFSQLASHKPRGAKDIPTYQRHWLAVLSMESASNAVSEDDSLIIRNVSIHWKFDSDSYSGVFQLRPNFCKARSIRKGNKTHDKLCILNDKVEVVSNFKYLGTVIDDKLNWKENTKVSRVADKEGVLSVCTADTLVGAVAVTDTSIILSANDVKLPRSNSSLVEARISCTLVGRRLKNSCFIIEDSSGLSPKSSSTVIPHVVNCASTWVNHNIGSLGQYGGSFNATEEIGLLTVAASGEIGLVLGLCWRLRFNCSDYLCVRYRGDYISHKGQNLSGVKNAWVGHCYITEVTSNDRESTKIVIRLNQSASKLPWSILYQQQKMKHLCTIEVIQKGISDQRLGDAVKSLSSGKSRLNKDIVLMLGGRKDDSIKRIPEITGIRGVALPPPNKDQKKAIKTALENSFRVIQGPPGTGKTVTGAQIAYYFSEMNTQIPSTGKRQVLYCGPSNKSVDVVAGYLKEFPDLTIVRVYSETIEKKDFPLPWEKNIGRKADIQTSTDPDHVNIALHHLIRKSGNSMSAKIIQLDEEFKEYSGPERIIEYLQLIELAKKEELKKYQIILATCNLAGSKFIKEYCSIRQCIIDEAGMCSEPESLIPLVMCSPYQVVLIGDHKQLRPIITEERAKHLGMEISLLERYQKKKMMLTKQYRMHPKICEFPSKAFYDNKLETDDHVINRKTENWEQEFWPAGSSCPIIFCHVNGKEETQTVKSLEASEQSKSNPHEVDHVVRIACKLLEKGVESKDVVILSQYRFQCKRIRTALKECGILVSTVFLSQGKEWDYVIMSTVRSLPGVEIEKRPSVGWIKTNLGFIADENQMNVALTRAKKGLILIGNRDLLETHPKWKELLQMYRQNKCIVDASDFKP